MFCYFITLYFIFLYHIIYIYTHVFQSINFKSSGFLLSAKYDDQPQDLGLLKLFCQEIEEIEAAVGEICVSCLAPTAVLRAPARSKVAQLGTE